MRSWLAAHPKAVARASRLIPNIKKTVQVEPVGPMVVRLRLNRRFWLGNPYKDDRLQFALMKRCINASTVAFDLGANIGYITRFMVGVAGAARCICFEPFADNIDLLNANIQLMGKEL